MIYISINNLRDSQLNVVTYGFDILLKPYGIIINTYVADISLWRFIWEIGIYRILCMKLYKNLKGFRKLYFI